jgi:UDP-glucose 4-epimerase
VKRVLITGANSYVGTNVEKWLNKEPNNYYVETLDMKGPNWKKFDFSTFDIVFHVAGIAHVSSKKSMKDLYFKVNRDLTIETAVKARAEGIKQFIFMSSIIVYGNSISNNNVIDLNTVPNPNNFYGESKLQAEKGIKNLESNDFKIVILRPPMIYGKESKGNYQKLVKLAKITPFFPNIDNERSMLHIDNLCELIKKIIEHEKSGFFFPQNSEYVKTSDLVKLIAKIHGKKIWITKIFNPIFKLFFRTGFFRKLFSNFIYKKSMSQYSNITYQIRTFNESIQLTEYRRE